MNTVLDFIERTAEATLKDARDSYDAMHERVHKLASLILSGAGGAGVYTLGKLGPGADLTQIIPLVLLSCWWLFIAARLFLRGGSSREIYLGTNPEQLRKSFNEHFAKIDTLDAAEEALEQTRWSQLASIEEQIESYAAGTTHRSSAIDFTYRALAFSPAVVLAGVVLSKAFVRPIL